MIGVGAYIKIILKKKRLRQQYIVNKINELGLNEGIAFHKFHLSSHLSEKVPISVFLARKIEIVLGLERYILVRMIKDLDKLSKKECEKIREIEGRVVNKKF